MTAFEIKLATALARRPETKYPFPDALVGCGLPDFQPVMVSLNEVAAFLRWQCLYLNGDWDGEEYQNCVAILRRKVTLTDIFPAEARQFLVQRAEERMGVPA